MPPCLSGHNTVWCWDAVTSNPRLLSAELLSSHSFPRMYLCPALLHLRCRTKSFPLLTFMPVLLAQCSNLSRFLFRGREKKKKKRRRKESRKKISLIYEMGLMVQMDTETRKIVPNYKNWNWKILYVMTVERFEKALNSVGVILKKEYLLCTLQDYYINP